MSRILLALALVSVCGGAAAAQRAAHGADRPGVGNTVSLLAVNRTAKAFEVDPAAIVTAVLHLTNKGTAAITLTSDVSVPQGWRVVAGAAPFAISPSDFEVHTIGIAISALARAGRYVVPIRLSSDSSLRVNDSIVVHVREQVRFDIVTADAASHVTAGGAYETKFAVRNTGNIELALRLSASSSTGSARLHSDETVRILPGRASLFSTTSTVRRTSGGNAADVTELRATEVSTGRMATASALVPIAEPAPGMFSGMRHLPATLTLRGSTGALRTAPVQLSGGGSLDPGQEGSTRVEFLLRPHAPEESISGERDEYRVAFHRGTGSLLLGDQLYELSPLTSGFAPGFGAGASVRGRRLMAHGYSQRARWPRPHQKESGAALGLSSPDNRTSVSFNAVSRSSGEIRGEVGSVNALLPLGSSGRLETEYAMSRHDGITGDARRAWITGRIGGAPYDLAFQSAGLAFAGPQRGGSYRSVNVGTPLIAGFAARVFENRYDNETTAMPQGKSRGLAETVGLGFESPFGITVDLLRVSSLSQSGDGELERRHGAVRVNAAMNFGSMRLIANSTVGRARDITVARISAFREISVAPEFLIGPHRLGLSYNFMDGKSALSNGVATTNLGLNGNFSLPFSTSLTMSGYGWRPAVLAGQWGAQVQTRLAHVLSNGHNVSLNIQRGSLLGSTGIHNIPGRQTVYLEYSAPLGVPVGRSRAPGQVSGRVVNPAGNPVSGAVVWVGNRAAITNRDGRMILSGLTPGNHSVTLGEHGRFQSEGATGRATVSVDSVRRTPATFIIEARKGGTVLVHVLNFATDPTIVDSASASRAVGTVLPNTMVSLASARDTLYQVTDEKGVAEFRDVSGGLWTAVILQGELPPFTAWEKAGVEVIVQPSQVHPIELRLIRKVRRVEPVTGGGVHELQPGTTLRLNLRNQK